MATVFHGRPYDKFIEMKVDFRRKVLRKMNQGSSFPQGSFSNGYSVRAVIQFRGERRVQYLKRKFFINGRPSQFHIKTQHLFEWSDEASSVLPALQSTSHFLRSPLLLSRRSDSSLEANCIYYYNLCSSVKSYIKSKTKIKSKTILRSAFGPKDLKPELS